MIKLYYSTSSKEDQPQSDPMYSLGGFKSSTVVSSGEIGAIFPNISEFTLEQLKTTYICLILKNEGTEDLQDINLWMDPVGEMLCNYRVAIVTDSNGEFETVNNINSKPIYAEFISCVGQSNTIAFDLEQNKMLGLWIERSIDKDNIELKNRKSCDVLYEQFKQDIKPSTEEEINLEIEW